MRAWIRVLDAPGCYECTAWAERKSALQGSGLVRTLGADAQRRVASMPRATATARDALSNHRRESDMRFERPAKQALVIATEPRAGLFFVIPVSSLVATFEQSENVAIAYLVGARATTCCAIIGTGSKFMPLPSAHALGTSGQSCIGRILIMNYVSMFCEHVLIMHTSHSIP